MSVQISNFPETNPGPGIKETYKGLEIIRYSPCGAEICNVDLSKDMDEETFQAILDVWHQNLVIYFRGQKLEAADQLRFGRRIGVLSEIHTENFVGEDPAIMYISNVKEDGEYVHALPVGEMMFHIDQCYTERPAQATILFSIAVPETRGNTMFVDLYRAYETLDDGVKAKIDGLKALNVYDYDAAATHAAKELSVDAPQHTQPVVRTHPVTGRKCLFINRLMTWSIEGMGDDDSKALLDQLFDHIENPDFVFEHRWQVGDMLMWDNRCTAHARRDFDPEESRIMRRLTVLGDKPT
ncbi:MAG: TauD/TfdA family dioxygenase [Rhodospirillales bacterium]|jgi:taurine dioxygenase|nr:TauD/TfdA family dioxygenase [Rhodospirillales bacterium]MBT4006907.1 TauD/TfdA family dioxygenase [Rhodospirillales bacterium]MBT5113066.1 TauD/TfdA family dioxygenase [Rhodospirillales bacterium]MBT5672942.1 TauD/TfdA family dioxygenase [Rhodospirillales bacterium]MBT6187619.1 TauD/TfdA family dioxygenase [Rhodospirillales bacterium]